MTDKRAEAVIFPSLQSWLSNVIIISATKISIDGSFAESTITVRFGEEWWKMWTDTEQESQRMYGTSFWL